MTLQQLRYLIAVSEQGSINAAAQSLYVSQSNLSTAIKELERELGIVIFTRTNRGVTLTNDGTELLGYARQVVEQADMLEDRYARGRASSMHLAVSTQHYYFSLQAFINVAEQCASDRYDFVLRECATGQIIEDVRTFRSDIGVLYLDSFNARVLKKAMAEVQRKLAAGGFQAKMLLQVHDELIVECPEAECERVKTVLREEMEGAADFSVPLTCEAKAGRSWAEAH